MVKHVHPLTRDGQKHPFPLLIHVAFARLGEVEKVLLVARFATHKFLMSVHAVVGLKLFATCVAVKHMITALLIHVLVNVSKPSKTLSQKLQGQTLYLSSRSQALGHSTCSEGVSSPTLFLSSNIMNSPQNMSLTPASPIASR